MLVPWLFALAGSCAGTVAPPNGSTLVLHLQTQPDSDIVLPGSVQVLSKNYTIAKFDANLTGARVISSGSMHVTVNQSGDANVFPHAISAGNASVQLRLIYGPNDDVAVDYFYDFTVTDDAQLTETPGAAADSRPMHLAGAVDFVQ